MSCALVARTVFVRRQHAMSRVSARCHAILCIVNSPRLESLVLIILLIYLTVGSVAAEKELIQLGAVKRILDLFFE